MQNKARVTSGREYSIKGIVGDGVMRAEGLPSMGENIDNDFSPNEGVENTLGVSIDKKNAPSERLPIVKIRGGMIGDRSSQDVSDEGVSVVEMKKMSSGDEVTEYGEG